MLFHLKIVLLVTFFSIFDNYKCIAVAGITRHSTPLSRKTPLCITGRSINSKDKSNLDNHHQENGDQNEYQLINGEDISGILKKSQTLTLKGRGNGLYPDRWGPKDHHCTYQTEWLLIFILLV